MVAPEPGSVYQDDLSITDDELIFRMIRASNTKWVDGTATRAATNAFQDRREEDLEDLGVPAVAVSVYLESEMQIHGSTPQTLVERWGADYGVASITARQAREQGQGLVRNPQAGNPEHAMIFVKVGARKTNGQSKKLAAASKVVIPPPPAQ